MLIKDSDIDGNGTYPKQQAFSKASSLITRVITTCIMFFFYLNVLVPLLGKKVTIIKIINMVLDFFRCLMTYRNCLKNQTNQLRYQQLQQVAII